MPLKEWYEDFDFGMKEFSCPKCNKIIIGMMELKLWIPPKLSD
jgi:hypothetical protein